MEMSSFKRTFNKVVLNRLGPRTKSIIYVVSLLHSVSALVQSPLPLTCWHLLVMHWHVDCVVAGVACICWVLLILGTRSQRIRPCRCSGNPWYLQFAGGLHTCAVGLMALVAMLYIPCVARLHLGQGVWLKATAVNNCSQYRPLRY